MNPAFTSDLCVYQPSESPMESLSRCIAALEDCDDEDVQMRDAFVASSLWTKCDDLCAGLTRLHSHAVASSSSIDDQIELLKKLFLLQTSLSSSSLSLSHDDVFSSDAAHTAILLDDAYESSAQSQPPQHRLEEETRDRVEMLTRTLRFYVHHRQQHQQSATQILNTLVRLHLRHLTLNDTHESLSCIEKAVAIHADASKEQQQQHHITSLCVMLYHALVKAGNTEQVCILRSVVDGLFPCFCKPFSVL
jgi:hypothetical protein